MALTLSQSRNPIMRQRSLDLLAQRGECLQDWVRRLRDDLKMQREAIIQFGTRRGFLDEEMDAALIGIDVQDFRYKI
jgi:hypothetical protein